MQIELRSIERKNVDQLVAYIVDKKYFEQERTGLFMELSPQYFAHQVLAKKASEEELIKLCSHKNPVVRCYAFMALAGQGSSRTFEILLEHITDVSQFEANYGCFGGVKENVTDIFLRTVGYHDEYAICGLSKEQTRLVDSLILYGKEILPQDRDVGVMRYDSRVRMLESADVFLVYYDRIKELATLGNPYAIRLLGKFRNPHDIQFLKKMFSRTNAAFTKACILEAITDFPDTEFYPFLKKMLDGLRKDRDRYRYDADLFSALLQYKTEETRQLFVGYLDDPKQCGLPFESLYYAFEKYPDKIFEGIACDLYVRKAQSVLGVVVSEISRLSIMRNEHDPINNEIVLTEINDDCL
jgi:hypothetical protein